MLVVEAVRLLIVKWNEVSQNIDGCNYCIVMSLRCSIVVCVTFYPSSDEGPCALLGRLIAYPPLRHVPFDNLQVIGNI